ncbi:hypothetical protein BCR36DRAFT_369259 [Piromyces finnis]|uniref:Uncharacterized protein n=1 Tax=Piromyces finnis TaxID=1754191 RepID=A0A1Y1VER5_9FUNG|nr:hypothetical protein BCR36DRAFT_369259 [Piromyces finnis]|eukprot:ORX53002.1 hypothetical protein BCR36DRAFT_369259 [Piromyces finnis]
MGFEFNKLYEFVKSKDLVKFIFNEELNNVIKLRIRYNIHLNIDELKENEIIDLNKASYNEENEWIEILNKLNEIDFSVLSKTFFILCQYLIAIDTKDINCIKLLKYKIFRRNCRTK